MGDAWVDNAELWIVGRVDGRTVAQIIPPDRRVEGWSGRGPLGWELGWVRVIESNPVARDRASIGLLRLACVVFALAGCT